jgi:hypothetical protein
MKIKIKTSELTGAALDWAVAKCEGLERRDGAWYRPATPVYAAWRYAQWQPSTNWALGGPLIERECMEISCIHTAGWTPNTWTARHPQRITVKGPTPLIAAMRCYVASQIGDEIEAPDELG